MHHAGTYSISEQHDFANYFLSNISDGKIMRHAFLQISVSRAGPYSTAAAKNGPTGSAYITYRRAADAKRCIETVHGAMWGGAAICVFASDVSREGVSLSRCLGTVIFMPLAECMAFWTGKVMKACYGTTKYCNAFLKGLVCNNSDCLYLHDVGEH